MFKNLIPKIFYDHLQDELDFFVGGLRFEVRYQDAGMAVIEHDAAKAYLVQSCGVRRPRSAGVWHRHRRHRRDPCGNVQARTAPAAPELQHDLVEAMRRQGVRHAGQEHGLRYLP